MNNLSFLLIILIAVLISSCSNDENGFEIQKDQLGMIMPASEGANAKVIFFENGTIAKPISGISNFNQLRIGMTFLITFKKESTSDGITNIAVLNFNEAANANFVPATTKQTQISGAYSGYIFTFNADSTKMHEGELSIEFNGSNYEYEINETGEPQISGSGTYKIDEGVISFTHNPPAPLSDMILNGDYYGGFYDNNLFFYSTSEDGALKTYTLKKNQ